MSKDTAQRELTKCRETDGETNEVTIKHDSLAVVLTNFSTMDREKQRETEPNKHVGTNIIRVDLIVTRTETCLIHELNSRLCRILIEFFFLSFFLSKSADGKPSTILFPFYLTAVRKTHTGPSPRLLKRITGIKT